MGSTVLMWMFGVAAIAVALPGAMTAAHLAVLGMASLFYREPRPQGNVPVRFLVVVPAHNEASVIAATLQAINRCLRPGDVVLVVDDRSTDGTGDIAASHGAVVLRRHPHEAPGRAAARQAAIDHAAGLEWDAMVMIDADSTIEPGFLDAAERMLGTGAMALQARSEAEKGNRLIDQAALASFALQGVLMPRGRDRLGALVRLRGTGMVLRREIIERFKFTAPASEDLVYSLELCAAGIRIRHLEGARLRSQNAGSWQVASEQKLRYEVGRMAAARRHVGPLLRLRSLAGLEAAWFLATPPFATAAMSLSAGLAIALVGVAFGAPVAVAAAIGGLLSVLACVLLLGIVQARLSPRVLLGLVASPGYLAWKMAVQVRALFVVRSGPREFGATTRRD